MRSFIYSTRDANGERSGWVVVKTGSRQASVQQAMIDQGRAAIDQLAATDPRRSQIVGWLNDAIERWPLPVGEYPLVGRSSIVIESDDITTRAALRTEAEYRQAVIRGGRPARRATTTPAAALAAVAKARQAGAASANQRGR